MTDADPLEVFLAAGRRGRLLLAGLLEGALAGAEKSTTQWDLTRGRPGDRAGLGARETFRAIYHANDRQEAETRQRWAAGPVTGPAESINHGSRLRADRKRAAPWSAHAGAGQDERQ